MSFLLKDRPNVDPATGQDRSFVDKALDLVPSVELDIGKVGRVAGDIAQGTTVDLPRAVGKGVLDAGQSFLDLTDTVGDFLNENVADLGRPRLFNDKGEFDPDLFAAAKPDETGVTLPNLDEAPSGTGKVISTLTQFLVPFGLAGKAFKGTQIGAKLADKPLTSAGLKGAIADFVGFSGSEDTLAELIQSAPALQNPVTEFLASEDDDPELEARLKNALEGVLVGGLLDSAVKALGAGLRAQKAGRQVAGERQTASEPATVAEPQPFQVLGDITDEALITTRKPAALGDDVSAQALEAVDEAGEAAATALIATARRFKAASERLKSDAPVTLEDLKRFDSEEATASVDVEDVMMLAQLAREAPAKAPESLSQFVKTQGGLQDIGGDIAQIIGGANKRPGLINKSGRPLDDAAHDAWEQGFIPGTERPSINEFLDYLEQDLIGTARVVRQTDQEQAIAFAAGREARDELDRLGLLGLRSEDTLRQRAAEALNPAPRAASSRPAGEAAPSSLDDTTLTGPERADLGGEEQFVNFARIDAEQDVKSVIGQMADAFKGDIDQATRGVRTLKQIELDANEIDAFEALQARRQGEFPSAETQVAMRQLWTQSGRKLREVANLASVNPSDENLFAFRKMMATHWVIQREVMAIRTETARALAAWRIPAGAGPDLRNQQLNDAIQAFGSEGVSRRLAERVKQAYDDPDLGPRVADKLVDRGSLARTHDAVQEFWINALLSGPKTHLVNMLSNTAVLGLRIAERAIAARLSKALGTDQGVELGEASAMASSLIDGFKDGFVYAGKTMRTGETGQFRADVSGAASSVNKAEIMQGTRRQAFSAAGFGIRGDNWLGKSVDFVGAAINLPGRALTAEDELFKTVGYRMELHARAHRMASQEVRDGTIAQDQFKARMVDILEDPPQDIALAAVNNAAYQTFTDQAGKIAGAAKVLGSEFPAIRYLVPFVNTPARIMSFTFERTPLAPVMQGFRDNIRAGGARRDTALAQLGTGSMIVFGGVDLAMNGIVTGGGPDDFSERGTLRRAGWQPYSVKLDIGGQERYFAFNRLDPLGLLLGLSGDMFEILTAQDWDSSSEGDISEALSAVTGAVAKNLTNKTFFTGISSFFEMISDVDRYAERFFQRFAGSFIPAGVKEITRFDDPVARHATNMLQEMKARTPILSRDMPARRDLFGREISFSSGLGWGYDMVSPVYSKPFKPEPIDAMMIDQGWFLGKPSKRLSFGGVYFNTRNRPEVYSRFLELQGNALKHPSFGLGQKDLLNAVVEGRHVLAGTFNNLTDGDEGGKEKFVRRIVSEYRQLARRRILIEFPDVAREVEQRQEERRIRLGR